MMKEQSDGNIIDERENRSGKPNNIFFLIRQIWSARPWTRAAHSMMKEQSDGNIIDERENRRSSYRCQAAIDDTCWIRLSRVRCRKIFLASARFRHLMISGLVLPSASLRCM